MVGQSTCQHLGLMSGVVHACGFRTHYRRRTAVGNWIPSTAVAFECGATAVTHIWRCRLRQRLRLVLANGIGVAYAVIEIRQPYVCVHVCVLVVIIRTDKTQTL